MLEYPIKGGNGADEKCRSDHELESEPEGTPSLVPFEARQQFGFVCDLHLPSLAACRYVGS